MSSLSGHDEQPEDPEDEDAVDDEIESETRSFLRLEGGTKPRSSVCERRGSRLLTLVVLILTVAVAAKYVLTSSRGGVRVDEETELKLPQNSSFDQRDNSSQVYTSAHPSQTPTTEPTQQSKQQHTQIPDHELLNGGSLSALRQRQIQNYRDGKGLIINFHITSHGGTTLCNWAKLIGPTPSFACMNDENLPEELEPSSVRYTPWRRNETDLWIRMWRKHYHYYSWEYYLRRLIRSVNETDWENPNLLSIIVMRNPIDRLLHNIGTHAVFNGTDEEWWDYANDRRSNNFALRTIVSPQSCCQGSDTPRELLENAKSYLKRFTLILDLDCLDSSLPKLSNLLNVTMPTFNTHRNQHHPGVKSARERIANDTLYAYLVQRNIQDMRLYKWAKERAFFKCPSSNESVVDWDALGDLDIDL